MLWPGHERATRCPHCGKLHTHASGVTTDGAPARGDVTVCYGCGQVCVFTDDLVLRLPTAEEQAEFSQLPDVQRAKFAWAMTVATKGPAP